MSKQRQINVKVIGSGTGVLETIKSELVGKDLPFNDKNFKVIEAEEPTPGNISVVLEGDDFDSMNDDTHLSMAYETEDGSYEVNIV